MRRSIKTLRKRDVIATDDEICMGSRSFSPNGRYFAGVSRDGRHDVRLEGSIRSLLPIQALGYHALNSLLDPRSI